MRGAGLHTGRRATVTLRPASAGDGRRIAGAGGEPVPIDWTRWVPSAMSTSVTLGGGRKVRTIEHLMAALTAYGVDDVLIAVEGTEIPIFDGSAQHWCASLRGAGLATLDGPRRAIRIRRLVQVSHDGGFLRAEPGEGFAVDVTHDVLPGFPVMRWHGPVDADRFDRELARSRSFGNLYRRLGLMPKPRPRPPGAALVATNQPDAALASSEAPWAMIAARKAEAAAAPAEPLLRGWRPWRAVLIVDDRLLPWPRYADEPVRHVTLDMIGDLALAGAPLIGRVVAHNPSHEKTFALVVALMSDPANWEYADDASRAEPL